MKGTFFDLNFSLCQTVCDNAHAKGEKKLGRPIRLKKEKIKHKITDLTEPVKYIEYSHK